ncbi:MAG: ribosome biogenesis GTP-binding protein YihA/YsxC [Alphaproteobacteria bacterium]
MAFETKGKELFKNETTFLRGAATPDFFPRDLLPEIAFAGRSNVGKSSLINALTGQPVARASSTPGRTQEINFFKLGTRFCLVDMPGYGFANAPVQQVRSWTQLVHFYLRERRQLKRVFLLIDARHGLKKVDEDIMIMLDRAGVSYQIVLTKADKLKASDQQAVFEKTSLQGKEHVACYPKVILTSSEKGTGMMELRGAIYQALEGV